MKRRESSQSSDGIRFIKEASEGNNILCGGIIALFVFRTFHQSLKYVLESQFIDLGYHYFYSSMARSGFDLFDPGAIEKAKLLFPMRFAGGQAIYSPSYFFFFQPLTYIPFKVLAILWLIFSLTLVILTVIILLRHGKWDRSWLQLTFVIVLVTNFQPLYEDLVLGQNNCLLLLFAVGAWYGFKTGRQWISGFSIAAMAFIKIQFGFLFLFIVLLGEVRVFLISSFWWVILFLSGLPQFGVAHYYKYFFALKNHTTKVAVDLNNLSLNALWQRMLGNEMLATLVYFVTSLVLFIFIYRWCYRHKRLFTMEIPMLVGITMIPILSPHTEPHHLVIIILPLLFAGMNISKTSGNAKVLFIASTVLIASRYSWNRFATAGGGLFMPLLSLKVIGVLFLLIVLIKTGSVQNSDIPTAQAPGNKKL